MLTRLWLRLMARLFGPRPVALSAGTGPFLHGPVPVLYPAPTAGPVRATPQGGSVRVPTCECHGVVACPALRPTGMILAAPAPKPSDPPAKLFYELASAAAECGEFEAAATYLIEASRRDG